jgi:predicted aconitase with swiveling domain
LSEPLVEPVEYALVIGQPEPVVIAGSVVMALVIRHPKPVKIVGAVVMTLVVVVVMAG